MAWTHIFDLILKITTFFLAILILVQIPFLEEHAIAMIIIAMILFFLAYNYLVRSAATFLYCRFTLKMKVTFSEAKKLNDALSPFFPFNLQWLPMTEIAKVDPASKYESALEIQRKWLEEKKLSRIEKKLHFKNSSLITKVLTVIMFLLVAYFIIASFLNLPPANYITDAYCRLFETDSYYPILNSFVLILPTILIFKNFDKNILKEI